MVQEQTHRHTSSRKPIPIVPSLIIGIGIYGREVGKQLAARLLLTEDGLREDGLTRPLLVRKHATTGETSPGLIRIMELDWDRWFANDLAADKLLTDIEVVSSQITDEGTPLQMREDNRDPADWAEARQALPSTTEHLFEVSLPLRTHDTPIRIGNFLPQGQEQDFTMHLFVVCEARQADTAALLPDLLRVLGKAYVIRAGITRGIQLFCYVGATSRAEHLRAGGDNASYEQRFPLEIERILPLNRRPPAPAGTPLSPGLLDQIYELWQQSLPQTIEACYLIDTQLANKAVVVQNRPHEPDEAVIASALALNMFITSTGNYAIRRITTPRWDLNHATTQPGPFLSFGIASYALDHPRLRSLVYNIVFGMFLQRALPITRGDRRLPQQTLSSAQSEELFDDPQLDHQLNNDVDERLNTFVQTLQWETLKPRITPLRIDGNRKIDYKKALVSLAQVDPYNHAQLKEEVERIVTSLTVEMSDDALMNRIHERQQLYYNSIQSDLTRLHQNMLNSSEAPMTFISRFVIKCLAQLKIVVQEANAPAPTTDLLAAKRTFAQNASARYHTEIAKRLTQIKEQLVSKPHKIGALGRTLLLLPLCVTLLKVVLASSLVALLPIWLWSLILVLPFYTGIYLFYQQNQQRHIRQQLKHIAKNYEAILQESEREAWKLALTQTLLDTEELDQRIQPLCRPTGVLASLRAECLSDDVKTPNRVLEYVFLDEYLKQELKKVSQQLAAQGHLWKERQRLLQTVLERNWTNQNEIGDWLRAETELLYHDEAYIIVDSISSSLNHQTQRRLEEMWRELSSTVVHFLRYTVISQDDADADKKMFSVHATQNLQKIDTVIRQSETEILDSADRLRWTFMRVQPGLRTDSTLFSIETLLP